MYQLRKNFVFVFLSIAVSLMMFPNYLSADLDEYDASSINGGEVSIDYNGVNIVLEPSSNFLAIKALRTFSKKTLDLERLVANYHRFPYENTYLMVSGELPFLLPFLKKNPNFFVRIPVYLMRPVQSNNNEGILVIPTNKVRAQFERPVSQREINDIAKVLSNEHRLRVIGVGHGQMRANDEGTKRFIKVLFEIDPTETVKIFKIRDSLTQLQAHTVEIELIFHFLEF